MLAVTNIWSFTASFGFNCSLLLVFFNNAFRQKPTNRLRHRSSRVQKLLIVVGTLGGALCMAAAVLAVCYCPSHLSVDGRWRRSRGYTRHNEWVFCYYSSLSVHSQIDFVVKPCCIEYIRSILTYWLLIRVLRTTLKYVIWTISLYDYRPCHSVHYQTAVDNVQYRWTNFAWVRRSRDCLMGVHINTCTITFPSACNPGWFYTTWFNIDFATKKRLDVLPLKSPRQVSPVSTKLCFHVTSWRTNLVLKKYSLSISATSRVARRCPE